MHDLLGVPFLEVILSFTKRIDFQQGKNTLFVCFFPSDL
jgi:hypothetical protein